MKPLTALLSLIVIYQVAVAEIVFPVDLVRGTTNSVLEQLNTNRSTLEQQPEMINEVVRDLIVPQFDFENMAMLILGKYWYQINSIDQLCSVSGFRNTLVERYAYILLSYDNHEVSYTTSIPIGDEGHRMVKQIISRENMTPLPIEYLMKPVGEEWKVIDLIIDGVSLVRNYRGIYQSRIHIHGLPYFIKSFPECNY